MQFNLTFLFQWALSITKERLRLIKVVLVDDQDLVRTGIKLILQDVSDFNIVNEARSGEDAVSICRKSPPDVVLMDVNMPGIGGMEATKQICRLAENTRVICLSQLKDEPIPSQVMQLGAHGFLTKDAEPEEVINAIYKVAAGQKYIAADIAQAMAMKSFGGANGNPFEDLSSRELDIAMRLTSGVRVPEIANQLNISAKTVNTYRYRMFEKLGVESDVELTHLALRHKLIKTDSM